MIDVRQGPLLIANDPLATAAERCTVARMESPAELAALLDPRRAGTRPTLTAYQGFDPAGGPLAGRPVYYRASDGWRDTITNEVWHAH